MRKKISAVLPLIIILVVASFTIHNNTNTTGITISADYTQLECAPSIRIVKAKNIEEFLQQNDEHTDVKEQICAIDAAFDGQRTDRALLFSFTTRVLEFWAFNRHDIAHYFYRRIIESNPDDALSLYILEEIGAKLYLFSPTYDIS